MDQFIKSLGGYKALKYRIVFLVLAVIITVVPLSKKEPKKEIVEVETTTVETTTAKPLETTTEDKTEKEINPGASSLEKDLYIRFYKKDWALFTGIEFEVDVTDASGKTTHYIDEDKDGKINISNVTPGNAKIEIKEVKDYTLINSVIYCQVKDHVEYKPIEHIEAEVKHDGQEDTNKKEDTKVLEDTVEYVESTKTELISYEEVQSAEIVVPTESTTDESTTTAVENDTTTTIKTDSDEEPLKDCKGNNLYKKENDKYVEVLNKDYLDTETYYKAVVTYKYTGWQNIDGKMYYYDKAGNVVTGKQVIKGVEYTFSQTGVRGGSIGIDVSVYQGNIDWAKVKAAGIDFVIIRVGYRGYGSEGNMRGDDMFDKNIKGAIAAGLNVGVYYFSQAITEAEAVQEASYCISKVQGYKLSLPIFIDTESAGGMYNGSWYEGRANSMSAAQRTKVCLAFCKTITNAGYKAGVYSGKWYFLNKLNASELEGYTIWLAEWGVDTPTYPRRYDIWQKSETGKVDGISGNVDMNYS